MLDVLHRNLSLLGLAVLAAHIVTAVLDSFAPITLLDAVVPFASRYRPLWLGLGALAFDLLMTVLVTSALRRRIGYRAWRFVHWGAYASWPLAVVHGLGTGTDPRASWMLIVTLVCAGAVVAAIGFRIATGPPEHRDARAVAGAALVAGVVALAVWLPGGPLARGWARRAGTPAELLASTSRPAAARLPSSFQATLSGTPRENEIGQGLVSIDLPMTMSGGASGSVDVRLLGQPGQGGGVALSQGSVTAGPSGSPALYSGRVTGLQGGRISAVVKGRGVQSLDLTIDVTIDPSGQQVSGTISGSPSH